MRLFVPVYCRSVRAVAAARFSSAPLFLLPPIGEVVITAHARSGQVTRIQTGHSFVPVATFFPSSLFCCGRLLVMEMVFI